MNINNDNKLKKVMELIEEVANSHDENQIKKWVTELREITGNPDINAIDCMDYWSWTSLEDLGLTFLIPAPVRQGLDDEQLADIIKKLYNAEYSQSETDHQINVLKKETGISNISDYIYWPDQVGLERNADESEIIAKILSDKKVQ